MSKEICLKNLIKSKRIIIQKLNNFYIMYETIGIHETTTYTEPKTVIVLEIIPQKTLDNILVKDIKLNEFTWTGKIKIWTDNVKNKLVKSISSILFTLSLFTFNNTFCFASVKYGLNKIIPKVAKTDRIKPVFNILKGA